MNSHAQDCPQQEHEELAGRIYKSVHTFQDLAQRSMACSESQVLHGTYFNHR